MHIVGYNPNYFKIMEQSSIRPTLEEFIEEIEFIESVQTDTRPGCILMLSAVKKLKRKIEAQLHDK